MNEPMNIGENSYVLGFPIHKLCINQLAPAEDRSRTKYERPRLVWFFFICEQNTIVCVDTHQFFGYGFLNGIPLVPVRFQCAFVEDSSNSWTQLCDAKK